MPFYEYFCDSCKNNFKTYHGTEEKADSCPRCESAEVIKTLPQLNILKPITKEASAGQRVEKFIEESREILKDQAAESRKELKV
jgi:putative FmdB family regulatory protein